LHILWRANHPLMMLQTVWRFISQILRSHVMC